MKRKIPLLELRKKNNWSRVHPLTWLFVISSIILIMGIMVSKLNFFIVPSLIIIIIYLIFFWKFVSPLFE